MKRVLFYTDTPQVGGAELQMLLLAKFLSENSCGAEDRPKKSKKFEVSLCCSDYRQLDSWCKKFENLGVNVFRLNVLHKHDPRHFFGLKKILKGEINSRLVKSTVDSDVCSMGEGLNKKFDLLHCHVWNPVSCRYAFAAARVLNIPVVVTEHDPFELSGLGGWLKNLIKIKNYKKVKKIVSVSEENLNLLKEIYPQYANKISVIHNGIDVDQWLKLLAEVDNGQIFENFKKEFRDFKIDKKNLILLTIAEMHQRKGIDRLLKALNLLIFSSEFKDLSSKLVEKIKLFLVGDGPQIKEFKEMSKSLKVSKYVKFLGRRDDIPDLLSISDIFILPSRREAFGFVNLEAMIAGLPVIASDVGGISEILEDQKTGILVKDSENDQIFVKNLASSLCNLLLDSEKCRVFGEKGKKRVQEKFNAKMMAEEYEYLYEDILKNK